MEDTYSIGEVARRTGLSVSAIRFYSDAGIVAPTGHTGAGYRRYDLRAVAGLELVRTLRELGASLDEIRRLLADKITLPELATAHLAIVEGQLSRFQARRAVLRTVVRQGGTTAQVSLMHKLVSMSDDARLQLIEEFWTDVTAGLEAQDFFAGHLRPWWPRLPPEPTSGQLEAWIELADLVQDADFREAVRRFLAETFAGSADPERETLLTDDDVEQQVAFLTEARAAAEAGVPVDSPRARDLANRWVTWMAARAGNQNFAEVRRRLIDADPNPHLIRHAELLGRYSSLTATVNGALPPQPTAAPASTWLHAAAAALPR
ncbi:MerR family transcriptional regulator [Actinoplanes sp. NBRC 14428]|uniref:DNA-binding transcriptional MerR regulator n=1 Tax=Pseudosporangium ferrugineum TaxID=439699 RepID=A0A2T0RQJ5_9ACTN|nr:MerR family transcriptional regulator [Pseudosporangium ferrugineum]PRY23380.1 DNA-binding transcriptional MerR regulator [Pseudosporangium ferrugineum]BCJ55368.1 MerR family transcriptional regulator [Actinoplanes sp. NBRC 14428]